MLCKHEVVGSIPSGSTFLGLFWDLPARLCRAVVIEAVKWVPTPVRILSEREFAACGEREGPMAPGRRVVSEVILHREEGM